MLKLVKLQVISVRNQKAVSCLEKWQGLVNVKALVENNLVLALEVMQKEMVSQLWWMMFLLEKRLPNFQGESSPSSSSLFAPHYAGSINNIQYGATDDDCWKKDIMEDVQEDIDISCNGLEDEFSDEMVDEGKPPVVSEHDLEKLDI